MFLWDSTSGRFSSYKMFLQEVLRYSLYCKFAIRGIYYFTFCRGRKRPPTLHTYVILTISVCRDATTTANKSIIIYIYIIFGSNIRFNPRRNKREISLFSTAFRGYGVITETSLFVMWVLLYQLPACVYESYGFDERLQCII